MSKAMAKLTVKMMGADDVRVTQKGDNAEGLFMAVNAVAAIVLDSSNGSREKAGIFAKAAKMAIDDLINDAFERNDFAAAHSDPAATAEMQDGPAVNQPDDMDSVMEKIIADAMKRAKDDSSKMQGVMFKVPVGDDMPMEEVVKYIIGAVDKQARKTKKEYDDIQLSLSGRTYPEPSPATTERTSGRSWKNLPALDNQTLPFLDLRGGQMEQGRRNRRKRMVFGLATAGHSIFRSGPAQKTYRSYPRPWRSARRRNTI